MSGYELRLCDDEPAKIFLHSGCGEETFVCLLVDAETDENGYCEMLNIHLKEPSAPPKTPFQKDRETAIKQITEDIERIEKELREEDEFRSGLGDLADDITNVRLKLGHFLGTFTDENKTPSQNDENRTP